MIDKTLLHLPKLAIFDMDGLIFDTERLFMRNKNIVLEAHGYPARDEDFIQTIGLAGQLLYDKLEELYGPEYPADLITNETRAKVNHYMETHGPDVKPGIPQLLRFFQQHQIPCCVASSTRHEFVEKYLTLAGLDIFFSFIIGGEEVTRSKPDPEIFLLACQRSGVDPKDAIVLEDSENGVRAGFAAGIPVICIPDLVKPCDQVRQMTALVLESAEQAISHFSE